MCRVNLGDRNGIKVIKRHENDFTGVRVDMTRKMTREGIIKYAVIAYNMNTGAPYKIKMCKGIGIAFDTFKKAIA